MKKEDKEATIIIIVLLLLNIIIGIRIVKTYIKKNQIKEPIEATNKFVEADGKSEIIDDVVETKEESKIEKPKKEVQKTSTKSNETYKLTHYGYDCCKSGLTATGWDARNIYYNDEEYGEVRIVATSKAIPLYSIIKIYNYKLGGDITAIVLDRGVGNGVIDLLVENEAKSSQLGIQKGVKVEILRSGK